MVKRYCRRARDDPITADRIGDRQPRHGWRGLPAAFDWGEDGPRAGWQPSENRFDSGPSLSLFGPARFGRRDL